MSAGKKGKIDVGVFIGLTLFVFGTFSSIIAFMGFVLNNKNFIFMGSILFGLISIVIAILERLLK